MSTSENVKFFRFGWFPGPSQAKLLWWIVGGICSMQLSGNVYNCGKLLSAVRSADEANKSVFKWSVLHLSKIQLSVLFVYLKASLRVFGKT